ncbi:MAG TPA: alpha/beta hydrolase [Caulobacteraceae bacterium]|nr:alpha/beta hydrolase [Caulobacteraceae bacterium]
MNQSADATTPSFDPRIAQMLAYFQANLARPLQPENLPSIRARFATGRDGELAPGVTAEDIEAGGVPVRLYRPAGEGPWPLHVYLHGGGFVMGAARADGPLSRRAAASGSLVASVEYRLAPEHPFPAGVEDSYAALCGLVEQAGALGIATNAVTVGGASSGGNFAAVVALMTRDRGGTSLALQLLEIAGTDLTKSSYAWRTFRPGHDTTRERDLAMVDLYLPDMPSRAHPYASPLFAPDLAGLAPAYVMNAEFDPRRDECEAYVARLQDAGTPAVTRTLAGHVHGSMTLKDWPPAQAWEAEANRVLAAGNAAALAGRPLTTQDLQALTPPDD